VAEFDPPYTYTVFSNSIKRNFRYSYDDSASNFLSAVQESSDWRKLEWPKGKLLWRAQRGCLALNGGEWKEYISGDPPCKPYERERMVPERDKTREGRVNPKGIPCLYLATDKETAMSEVRPWKEGKVTVASFVATKDLSLVDCSWGFDAPVRRPTKESPGYPSPERFNWLLIDIAFSRPVSATDDLADYAPTQVLAEAFRRHGYDGIVYKSELGDGKNVALFNIEHASVVDCFLFSVESVRYEFSSLPLNAKGYWP
jgi:hypothetical protein